MPPKLTAVAPVKSTPVMVIVSPSFPNVGAKEVIVGGGIKVNPANVLVPSEVVTSMLPEVPLATTAVISVSELTEKEAAAVPPKLTAVVPVKLVPVIVTVAPLAALVGVNDIMFGGQLTLLESSVIAQP